jgi:hypothetical protein
VTSQPSPTTNWTANSRRRKECLLSLRREHNRRRREVADRERLGAEKAKEKHAAETSLATFLRQAWPTHEPGTPLVWGWCLDAVCEHLEAVRRRQIQNIYIGIPPGTLKSVTVNVMFPSWWWTTDPSVQFLSAGCSHDNVTRDSLACRDLIESDWYQER